MSGKNRNQEYLDYLRDNPELLKDEPPHVSSPKFWFKMLQEKRCTGELMDKSVVEARREWEQFHLNMAVSLGFDISIRQLHLDKTWLFGVSDN